MTTPLETALLQNLGARVRALRTQRGLTAKEVAERAGISARFYSQLEGGQANIAIARLARVARALAVPLAELVGGLDLVAAGERSRVVALLGLRGAGKSTVGRALADRLGVPFVELDERIEQAAGLSLTEIFNVHGEPYYRRLEARCLEDFLAEEAAAVVALPGGIVTNEPAFALARERTRTVWLRATPEEHMQRVLEQGDRRPMEGRGDAMAELRAILASREPLYARAERTIATSERPLAELVEELASIS